MTRIELNILISINIVTRSFAAAPNFGLLR